MNIDDVIAIARECGFSNLDATRKLVRGAVALRPIESGLHTLHVGSRLGGRPTLPKSVPWPKKDNHSLSFVAQIDLSLQPAMTTEEGFPSAGLLLFFYDAEQSTWGFDPKDAGSFVVIYVAEPGKASVMGDWPDDLPKHARYTACALATAGTMTLPPWESVLVDELGLDRVQLDAYQQLVEMTAGGDAFELRGLLGGYPDQVQGDMMLECALVAGGLHCGDTAAYRDPRLPAFRQAARDWRLLLQVPSAEAAGMMWGDLGCLYYWIHDDDLKARRFDRSWMILQCS